MASSFSSLLQSARRRLLSRKHAFSLILAILLIVVAAILLARMHTGHGWGGDFAQYLMHAQNIVEGQPYTETPYVRNPVNNNPGPPAYPPGFPLLLAPIYAAFGTAVIPMKVFIIVTFVAGLGLTAYLLRDDPPAPCALAVVAVLGFNPFLVGFTASVYSDLPFLFFVLLSLMTWQKSRAQSSSRRKMALAGLSGLLIYFAVLIRSLGVVLPASILVYELLDQRRLTPRALVGLGTVGLALGLQTIVSMLSAGASASAGVSYYSEMVQQNLLDRLPELAGSIYQSTYFYARGIAKVVWGPATFFIGPNISGLGVLTLLLMIGGWSHHAVTRLSSFDVFTPLYVAALLPWNFGWIRYLIPVLPFCAFYAVYALYGIRRWLQWKRPILVSGVVGILVLLYGWALVRNPATPSPKGALAPDAKRTYHHIRQHTSSGALIAFAKPRFVALKTGRRSVRWFKGRSERELLGYFADAGVDYALVGPLGDSRQRTITMLIENHPSRFAPTYQSTHYTLYRLVPDGEDAQSSGKPGLPHGTRVMCAVPDSFSGTEPMRAIRSSRSSAAPKCTVPMSRIVCSRHVPSVCRRKT